MVKAYAEAMIEHGRDTYGDKHTPLFAAVLDRADMTLGAFPGVDGVRRKDRSLFGANPQEEMELYEILYTLAELTKDQKYASAADEALKYYSDCFQRRSKMSQAASMSLMGGCPQRLAFRGSLAR